MIKKAVSPDTAPFMYGITLLYLDFLGKGTFIGF